MNEESNVEMLSNGRIVDWSKLSLKQLKDIREELREKENNIREKIDDELER